MALSKLAIRRLMKLADFMAALPKEAAKHFYMGSWLEHKGCDDHEFGKFIGKDDPLTCGTVACALGWAATVPAFRKAGLRVRPGNGSNNAVTNANFRAAEKFFDLKKTDAQPLFSYGDAGNTPKQWAAHCRKFIRENA